MFIIIRANTHVFNPYSRFLHLTMTERMRRVPRQARSQQRIDRILQAAALEFAEVGLEAATTNAIAARAGVPIGSLYQFFPNKEAILEALAARYAQDMRILNERTLSAEATAGRSTRAIIRQMLSGIAEFEMSHAAFGAIFLSAPTAKRDVHLEVVELVEALMASRFPFLDPERRRILAAVSVGIVKGLMLMLRPPDSLPLDTVLSELEEALLAYMRDFLLREGLPLPPD